MAFDVERLEGEPIIVVRGRREPDDHRREMIDMFTAVDALIGPDEKVFCITDLSDTKVNFSNMVMGMSSIRDRRPGSPSDPRITNIMVASGPLWNLAASAASQAQYGGVNVHLYSTVEEAIEFARQESRKKESPEPSPEQPGKSA
jgi:hypothetical protein